MKKKRFTWFWLSTFSMIFIAASLFSNLQAREIEFSDSEIFDELTKNQIEEILQTLEGNVRIDDVKYLRMAKFSLINGKLQNAKYYLNYVRDKNSKLTVIKNHYLALIAFIENDYIKALKHLNDVKSYDVTKFSIYCQLKILSAIGANKKDVVQEELTPCRNATDKYTKNDAFWFDSLVHLFLQQKISLNGKLFAASEQNLLDEELAKIWLKTNLYLNREARVIDLLKVLPESVYRSYSAREIIGFMLFRAGQFNEAMNFVEDINSVNAENIKANIRILDQAYELAFGHLQLALQKKPDSINALEKGIPVAWMIGQFSDGLTMLNHLPSDALSDKRTKNALSTAFFIRAKDYPKAQEEAITLRHSFQNKPPLVGLMMDTFLALKAKNTKKLEDYSEEACKNFDGMSCYIASQTTLWKNLGELISSDENTPSNTASFSLDELKQKKDVLSLKEETNIDQRDIEELDSIDAFNNGLRK